MISYFDSELGVIRDVDDEALEEFLDDDDLEAFLDSPAGADYLEYLTEEEIISMSDEEYETWLANRGGDLDA